MNIEKLKEWMDFAESCGEGEMWGELFNNVSSETTRRKRSVKMQYPLADIVQTNTEIIAIIEIPGVKRADLVLSVSGNILKLKGTSTRGIMDGERLQSERYQGNFEREFQLPCAFDGSLISARMEDGLLMIRFRNTGRSEERILLE